MNWLSFDGLDAAIYLMKKEVMKLRELTNYDGSDSIPKVTRKNYGSNGSGTKSTDNKDKGT